MLSLATAGSSGRRTKRFEANAAIALTLQCAALFLFGCSPAPSVPPKEPAQEGIKSDANVDATGAESDQHIADAFAEIALAERTIQQALTPAQPRPGPGTGGGEPTPGAPPPAGLSDGTETCTVACKALGSMRRSTSYLCRLSGDEDSRCTNAKTRLADAEKRVATARCTCRQEGAG